MKGRSKTADATSASGRATDSATATRGPEALDASDPTNIELVFGFVGPTGIDLNKVCDALRAQLRTVQYEVVEEHSMKQQQKSFMGQFQAARQEVAQLRSFMGESAKVATLTFPTARRIGELNQRTATPGKKNP